MQANSPPVGPMHRVFSFLKFPVLFIVVLLLIFSAYCNTLNSPPVLDDFHSFLTDRQINNEKDISVSALVSLSNTVFGWRRWIPVATFFLNSKLSDSLLYVHLTNIAIHMLSFCSMLFLIFELLRLEKRTQASNIDGLSKILAFGIAGAWALNPLQTNAVTYMVQRMTSIQACFYMLSVGLFIKGRRLHIDRRDWKAGLPFYSGCILSAIGAFFSKENSLMLPVMILMTEIWYFRSDLLSVLWIRLKKSHWSVWALLLLGGMALIYFSSTMIQNILDSYALRDFSLIERLMTESRVVVWYMSLILLPLPSRLTLDHDVQISTSLFHPMTTFPSIVALALMVWLIFRYRHRFPLITYGMLWYLLNLVIESTVIPLELIFEHRLYLPSAGFIAAFITGLVFFLRSLLGRLPQREFVTAISCGLAFILSISSLTTFIRNEAWENQITIYYDSVLKAPDKPRAHANLATALLKAGLHKEAIEEAELAINLGKGRREEFAVASQLIIGAYVEKGEFEKAIARGEELMARFPFRNANEASLPQVYFNLAEAYFQSEQLDKAYSIILKALDSVQLLIRENRYAFQNELDWTVQAFERILIRAHLNNLDIDGDGRPDPGNIPVKTWIAKKFLDLGDQEKARELLNQALSENPSEPETLQLVESINKERLLNQAQAKKENFIEKYFHHPFSRFNAPMAVAYLIQNKKILRPLKGLGEICVDYALKARPDSADAYLLKGMYSIEKNEVAEAVAASKRALELDPEYAKAWLELGYFQTTANQFDEAIAALNKTLELYPGYPKRMGVIRLLASLQNNEKANQQMPETF